VKRTLALLVLPFLAAGDFITPPPKWTADPAQAKALTEKANALSHFGGNAPVLATGHVFTVEYGALYVTGVAAKLTEHRDAAARVAVDSFLDGPKRAQITNAKVVIDESSARVDNDAKQIEAILHWNDNEAGSIMSARLLIAADAETLVAVTGECVLSLTRTGQEAFDGCIRSLKTLDVGIPAEKRVTLALVAPGTEPPPGPARPSTMSAPTMSDGSRTPMPPITLPPAEPKRTVDRRPVYVGAGLVVLAGLFWWNRRRRERVDASSVKKDTDE
jgi:hypothetical protein